MKSHNVASQNRIMPKEPKTKYVNLKNVLQITRGDSDKLFRYLIQFKILVSERLMELKSHIQQNNRAEIRQILHNMRPQLQFFEMSDVVPLITRLELEYDTISARELMKSGESIIFIIENALEEIEKLIAYYDQ